MTEQEWKNLKPGDKVRHTAWGDLEEFVYTISAVAPESKGAFEMPADPELHVVNYAHGGWDPIISCGRYNLISKANPERWLCLHNFSVLHETDSKERAVVWAETFCKADPTKHCNEITIAKVSAEVVGKHVEKVVKDYVTEVKEI